MANNSGREKEWYNDESFWRDMYPFMFTEQRFFEAEQQVEKVLNLTRPAGRRVLDLCCGPGRFAVPLALHDYQVTGVDVTGYLLEKAAAYAEEKEAEVEWIQSDMRDFARPGQYDLILNLFTSFGYFDDKEEDVEVLDKIYLNLRPGGACLIDVLGKECLARIFLPALTEVLPDGSRVVQVNQVFDDWTRVRAEWVLIRDGKAKSYRFHFTIYSGLELRERMEGSGFVDVRLYGGLDGDEYDTRAQRLIAVGRKPEARPAQHG